MSVKIIEFCFVSLLFMASFFEVHALTFSSDTVNAFNGKIWDENSGDDSIFITNSSSEPVVIDSIIVQFDTSGYEKFSISWMEGDTSGKPAARWGQQTGFYTVTDSVFILPLSQSGDQDLNQYNNGLLPKKTVGSGDTIKMYSPYFSKTFSAAGSRVTCAGGICIPPGSAYHYEHFYGRIIFVTLNHRDTLHLLCEQFWWTSRISMVPIRPHRDNFFNKTSSTPVNLKGEALFDMNKCSPSVFAGKERLINNFRIYPKSTGR
ncbi:MAG: hypothetical protein JW863_17705 [Chitinispirillaceae bacterium]|nr:hypothetical protein [Chitinispirillaceae bacterium]